MSSSSYRHLIVLVTFLELAISTCNSVAATPEPLTPAAQEAVDKGIIAAKVPDYLLAIRFFEEARQLAPDAPVIYLNMGLAESRIPGRELRAMAWFGAYLAAYPDAPNVTAVREQIDVLEVRNQSSLSRLITSVQQAALQKIISEPGSLYGSGEQNDAFLYDTAKLWIEVGDIAAAQKSLTLFIDPNPESMFSSKSHTLRDIAMAQAESGDIPAALKTVGFIQDDRGRSQALQFIAISQAEAGEIAGAKITADLIKGEWEKSWVQAAIAKIQAKAGDMAGSHLTFATSLKTAGRVLAAGDRSRLQAEIAKSQIDADDIAGAQSTLVEAQQSAAAGITDEQKNYVVEAIAEVQAKLDIASSLQTAPTPQSGIEPVVVADWLKLLDDSYKDSDCPLNHEAFLDLAGFLKSLPTDNAAPEQVFAMLHFTAEKVVKAHTVITEMLKQGVRK